MEPIDNSIIHQFNGQRAPTYSSEDVKTLVDTIEQFKDIIMNKSCNALMLKAKSATWRTIAKLYNEKASCKRPLDNLKVKWDNLKKSAKKISTDVFHDNNEPDDMTQKIYEWMTNAESVPIEIPPDIMNIINDNSEESGKSEDESNLSFMDNSYRKRGSNFSQKETRLLIQCVRAEKKYILCKNTTNKSNHMKNLAWDRIATEFNRKNDCERTLKMLQNKFCNMRKVLKNIGDNYNPKPMKKSTLDIKKIKKEPNDIEDMDDVDDGDFNIQFEDKRNIIPDPLGTLLNGSNDIDVLRDHSIENNEIVKLKLDLLKYQLETAKLEHQRTKEKLEAERAEAINKSVETSMRLRAARLEMVAAEAKLPSNHPSLVYTDEEMSAERYKLS